MDPILLDAIEYNGGGINTLLNRGAVKSVQRGFFETTIPFSDDNAIETDISISTIVPSKSICFVSADFVDMKGDGAAVNTLVKEVNATNIKIRLKMQPNIMANNQAFVSWQVIEFY